MRAFVVEKLAHPSEIILSHGVPEPTPGRGQVLVDVYSVGLNFFDVSKHSHISNQSANRELPDPAIARKIPA